MLGDQAAGITRIYFAGSEVLPVGVSGAQGVWSPAGEFELTAGQGNTSELSAFFGAGDQHLGGTPSTSRTTFGEITQADTQTPIPPGISGGAIFWANQSAQRIRAYVRLNLAAAGITALRFRFVDPLGAEDDDLVVLFRQEETANNAANPPVAYRLFGSQVAGAGGNDRTPRPWWTTLGKTSSVVVETTNYANPQSLATRYDDLSEWFRLNDETGTPLTFTSVTAGLTPEGASTGTFWQVVLTTPGKTPANAIMKTGYLRGVAGTEFVDKNLEFDLPVPNPPPEGVERTGFSQVLNRLDQLTAPRSLPELLRNRGDVELANKYSSPQIHVKSVTINMLNLTPAQLLKALSISVFQRAHVQAEFRPANLPALTYGKHLVGIIGFRHEMRENPRTWLMHVMLAPVDFLKGELAPPMDRPPWIINDPKAGYLDRDYWVLNAG